MLRPTDVLRMAVSVLRERKLRAILTIVGIAIGPAAVVAIIGTMEGYSSVILNQLSSLGQNVIAVIPGNYHLGESDIRYLENIENVDTVVPFYTTTAKFRRTDGKVLDVSLYATDLNELFRIISTLELREGKIPPASVYSSGIVGYEIAFSDDGEQLLKVGKPVTVTIYSIEGEKVTIKTKSIRTQGILDKYGNALVMNPDKTIFLPLKAGPAILGLTDYSGVLVVVEDSAFVPRVSEEIENHYGDLVNVVAFQSIARAVSSVIDALNFLLFAASMAAFAVAITGIMATMFTSVVERTREIGVLKAMGFSNSHVLVLILTEALVISLLGGILGVTMGSFGAYYLSSKSFIIRGTEITITATPAITPELIGKSLGLAVLVGIIGGLIPAYKAAKVPPIEALRYE